MIYYHTSKINISFFFDKTDIIVFESNGIKIIHKIEKILTINDKNYFVTNINIRNFSRFAYYWASFLMDSGC